MSIMAKTKITIEFEYACGPWADDITLKDLQEKSRQEAQLYSERVVSILHGQRISSRVTMIADPIIDLGERS